MQRSFDIIKDVISVERDAIDRLQHQQTCDFDLLVGAIVSSKGRVVVTGIGKSGIIGKKISTHLASTGTPSFFLHPVEALHGDLGMLTSDDLALILSYSGESEEILRLVPFLREKPCKIISMTGSPTSSLAKHSDFHINIHVEKEACPLRLAPTSSTTAALVMGDALASALVFRRGFKEENFARLHPGGRLGKMLLTNVEDVMHRLPLPLVTEECVFDEVVRVMTAHSLGTAIVTRKDGRLAGVVTDGDLRRALEDREKCFKKTAGEFMSRNPKSITGMDNLFKAESLFKEYKITGLVVTDPQQKPVGFLHIHNLR